jgi:predicted phosphoribosyltransferase
MGAVATGNMQVTNSDLVQALGISQSILDAAVEKEVAVPVAPLQTCEELKSEVDEVICTSTPDPFHAVGLWFENFTQLNDTDVRNILERAEQQFANHAGGP